MLLLAFQVTSMMAFFFILITNISFIHLDQLLLLDIFSLDRKLSSEVMITKSHVFFIPNLAIKISPDGKYLASAQNTFPGFPADIIIWDF